MANTVNDVMNVIASPDYGIKNIACTNQEILAILQGNHNSKYNLHNIVNDVKNILQKLVDSSTKSKSIEISNGSTKINNHIQDILDETKGIRKSIDNLAKEFLKRGGNNMPTIAKLSDKASQKVADAMIQDIDKHNKGGGLSTIVDAFNKLKNISLKDIIVGKQKVKLITKIFGNAKKELNIEENELNNVIKLINNTPEIMKSLLKVSRKITKIIKRDVINKLSEILVGKNSILTISKKLQKNETLFDNAQKIAKNIKELVLALNKVIFKLFSASLFAKFAEKGISNIEYIIDKLSSLSKKLIKIKDIEKGKETAKQMTVITGNLLVTSIFLTISAVTGGPALLGAIILNKMIDKIIPVVEKLSKNNKHINKSIDSSILLTACTGLMAVTSIILATIAVTGIPALLGSILMVGIVKLNIYTFKLLSKAQKPISKGAIVMSIMSVSLILYGIALKKISDATKNMDFKQIAIITSITLILSGTIIGLGYLIIPIGLGSMALGLMGVSLISYGIALKKISDATKSLTMENIVLVSESMLALGKAVAKMAILTVPITLGGVALGIMGVTLYTFVKTLKIISDMNDVPTKKVYQILTAMKLVGNFFKNNKLGLKSVWNANKYKLIMRPFAGTIKHLSKLKDMGIIPMKLVYGALNAMSSIANYYIENPIEKSVIKQARRYKRMLKPFGKTIDNLSKLKDLGTFPLTSVKNIVESLYYISNFYEKVNISDNIESKSEFIKYIVDKFNNMSVDIQDKLTNIKEIDYKAVKSIISSCRSIMNYYTYTKTFFTIKKVLKMNNAVNLFSKNVEYLKNITNNFTKSNFENVKLIVKSMKRIINFLKFNSLNIIQRRRAEKNITLLNLMSSAMHSISNINSSNILSVGDALINTLNGVNTIDIGQVESVTNMFKAFDRINRSENIINKFTESVKQFTTACENLIDNLSRNTDAINNIDTFGIDNTYTNIINGNNIIDNKSNNNNITQTNGIRIINVDEIAKTIAEKINGSLTLDIPDTQVQLLINGSGGNEWTITRY